MQRHHSGTSCGISTTALSMWRATATAKATTRHFAAGSRAPATAATRLHCTPSFSPAHPALLHTTLRAFAGPRRSTNITAQGDTSSSGMSARREVQNENGAGLRFDNALGRVTGGRRRGLYMYEATLFDPDPGLRPRGRSWPLPPPSPPRSFGPNTTPSRWAIIRRNLSRFRRRSPLMRSHKLMPFLKEGEFNPTWRALSAQANIFAVEADVGQGLGVAWGCP